MAPDLTRCLAQIRRIVTAKTWSSWRTENRSLPRSLTSMPASETDCERNRADQDEAERPDHVQVEPASRQILQAEIAVDQPRGAATGRDHGDRVHDGDNQ